MQVDNAFPGLLTQRIQRLLQVLFNMSGAIKLLVGGQTEQGAAPLNAAAGLAREERFQAARAADINDLASEDVGLEEEIAQRQEAEHLHQAACLSSSATRFCGWQSGFGVWRLLAR